MTKNEAHSTFERLLAQASKKIPEHGRQIAKLIAGFSFAMPPDNAEKFTEENITELSQAIRSMCKIYDRAYRELTDKYNRGEITLDVYQTSIRNL